MCSALLEEDHDVPLLDGESIQEGSRLGLEERAPQSEAQHSTTKRLLYTSHFLSTWNARVFEFGAFLFLAEIYPQTLLPASVYALSGSAAAAVLSPWVGSRIDSLNRMKVIRQSILGQRLAVAASCVTLSVMVWYPAIVQIKSISTVFLALVSVLAAVEKVCAVMNLISVERDWVVIVAAGDVQRLRTLNSQMRRIDLFCKLVGPLAIALVDGMSTKVAVLLTGCLTTISLPIEYFAIAKVYQAVPSLRTPKMTVGDESRSWGRPRLRGFFDKACSSTLLYMKHTAFLPSFSLALLYATVLSFSGPMTTYLLSLGMGSGAVGGVRAISTLFEVSATWAGPQMMARIGPIRTGIWFLNWQTFCVGIACCFLWLDFTPRIAAVGLVSAVIASRVGLWGFDLSAQIIIQDEVEESTRGTFSSHETALQNIFEMLAFIATMIFSRPDQFRYPAMMSACAVSIAAAVYTAYVRSRRGHLVHWSKCVERHAKGATRPGWQQVACDEGDHVELETRHVPA